MAKALNPFAPFEYVTLADRELPEPERTKFRLRGLNGSEFGHIAPELLLDDSTLAGCTGKGLDMALRYGLLGWENFENDKGAVAFHPHNFALIEHSVRAELAMQVIAASYVHKAEKKTSP